MTTPLAYEPHWEMHGFTGKQHLIVRETAFGRAWTTCGLVLPTHILVIGNYERGVNRCRSCDRSAS